MSASRRLQLWLGERRDDWARLARELAAERAGRLSPRQARETVGDYRALARDVAVARRDLAGTEVPQRLATLLQRAHAVLHREHEPLRRRLARIYRREIPAVTRRLRWVLAAVSALFLGSALAGWALVSAYPELGALFASEDMINGVQRGELWTDDLLNVVPSSLLSLGIISNNVSVALFAFVLGALYGLGTLYIVLLNGLMLGGVFAFVAQYSLAGRLFGFVVAHGVVELSVIVIAAAAGVRLGEALARPGQRPRAEAFRDAVTESGVLLWVVVPFLVLAGVIEGYVSPDPAADLRLRVTVGVVSGLLLWLVMTGRYWRSP